MDPLSITAGLCFAGLLGFLGLRWLTDETSQVRRRLRTVPRSDIRSAGDGPVKITGRVRLTPKSLIAPLSDRRCALYDVVVLATSGNQARVEIIHERIATDFSVEDATGTALVRGAGTPSLRLAVVHEDVAASGFFAPASPRLERYLQRWGEKSRQWLFNRSLDYREGLFEADAEVVIYGMGRREPDPDAAAVGEGYRDRPTRLVIEPVDGTLYLSNDARLVGAAK